MRFIINICPVYPAAFHQITPQHIYPGVSPTPLQIAVNAECYKHYSWRCITFLVYFDFVSAIYVCLDFIGSSSRFSPPSACPAPPRPVSQRHPSVLGSPTTNYIFRPCLLWAVKKPLCLTPPASFWGLGPPPHLVTTSMKVLKIKT